MSNNGENVGVWARADGRIGASVMSPDETFNLAYDAMAIATGSESGG